MYSDISPNVYVLVGMLVVGYLHSYQGNEGIFAIC